MTQNKVLTFEEFVKQFKSEFRAPEEALWYMVRSWDFCETQKNREIEGLQRVISEQSVVMNAYKLQTKSLIDANYEFKKENQKLKKKLDEAVEVIKYCDNNQSLFLIWGKITEFLKRNEL